MHWWLLQLISRATRDKKSKAAAYRSIHRKLDAVTGPIQALCAVYLMVTFHAMPEYTSSVPLLRRTLTWYSVLYSPANVTTSYELS